MQYAKSLFLLHPFLTTKLAPSVSVDASAEQRTLRGDGFLFVYSPYRDEIAIDLSARPWSIYRCWCLIRWQAVPIRLRWTTAMAKRGWNRQVRLTEAMIRFSSSMTWIERMQSRVCHLKSNGLPWNKSSGSTEPASRRHRYSDGDVATLTTESCLKGELAW